MRNCTTHLPEPVLKTSMHNIMCLHVFAIWQPQLNWAHVLCTLANACVYFDDLLITCIIYSESDAQYTKISIQVILNQNTEDIIKTIIVVHTQC